MFNIDELIEHLALVDENKVSRIANDFLNEYEQKTQDPNMKQLIRKMKSHLTIKVKEYCTLDEVLTITQQQSRKR